jgi:putative flippase GtrA
MRFSAAGASGFVVQLTVMWFLVAVSRVHYALAAAIAVEAAILVNFAWHHAWTWRDRPGTLWPRLIRFNALTALTSIGGSVLLTVLFTESMSVHPAVANAISVVVLSVVNFIGADRMVFRAGAAAIMVSVASSAHAGGTKLEAKTAAAFAKYAAAVEARRVTDAAAGGPFLTFERRGAADQLRIMSALRQGEVLVEPAAAASDAAGNEIPVSGGSINHWRGTVLIPGVTLDRVLGVLKDPTIDHRQEDVLSSRIVPRDANSQKLYLRVKRTKFITAVYDTEYDVEYRRLAADRAMSNSISTRIVEIEHAGTAQERALPEGNDRGFMWRLNSYWRYKQVAGGVLVEVESLTLSRDLPAVVGPLIRPIVNSTARESIARTLTSMRARFSR